MSIYREYSVETEEQTPISFHTNKFLAIIKCILTKNTTYVFEFSRDENDDLELIGCVFNKKSLFGGKQT